MHDEQQDYPDWVEAVMSSDPATFTREIEDFPTKAELQDDGGWDCEENGETWAWTFRSDSGWAFVWFTPRSDGDEKPTLHEVMPYVLSTPPF